MAENSHISWTTHTFNTHFGCTKVSQGCKHCYAESLSNRYGNDVWGPTAGRKPMSEAYWKQLAKWEKQAAASGVRPRVFCNSMSDLFEGLETCREPAAYTVVRQARARLLDLIPSCPHLDFLLLTKRPRNVQWFVPQSWMKGGGWPANAWIGTSVEDQAAAAERIPELLRVPAAVRFLSCEPLLGRVNLRHVDAEAAISEWCQIDALTGRHTDMGRPCSDVPSIHWVIVGGESGPDARPMHLEWARSLRDQCQASGVAFHFKQWGEWAPTNQLNRALDHGGRRYHSPPGDCVMLRVGKQAAGRTLDGRTWDEFPEVAL